MNAIISKNKKVITLENGTVIKAEKNEAAIDFIERAKEQVMTELMDELIITKEGETPKVLGDTEEPKISSKAVIEKAKAEAAEKAKAEAAEKAEAKRIADEEKAEAAEKARLEKEEARQKALEEKAEAKRIADEAKAEAKKLAEEEKEKARLEKEKAKQEALEEKEALRKAAQQAADEERKELIELRIVQMKKDAEVAAEKAIEDGKTKAAEILAKVEVDAENMRKGGNVGLDQSLIAYVKANKGKTVKFAPFGKAEDDEASKVVGTVKGCMCDKRVDVVFFKIVDEKGRTYHKNAATAKIEFLD